MTHILEGEHRLINGEPALVPRYIQLVHQLFERNVGVLEGFHDRFAHMPQKLKEACAFIDAEPHRQRVHEKSHDRFQFGNMAAADRRPDHDVALPADLVQEQNVSCQQGHEKGGVRARGQIPDSFRNRARQLNPFGTTFPGHHRRARMVDRQGKRLGGTDKAPLPKGQLAGQLLALHPFAMPCRKIPIRNRKVRQRRRLAFPERAIQGRHLLVDQIERPAIPDDVVRHENERILLFLEPEQSSAKQGGAGEVEWHGYEGVDAVAQHILAI